MRAAREQDQRRKNGQCALYFHNGLLWFSLFPLNTKCRACPPWPAMGFLPEAAPAACRYLLLFFGLKCIHARRRAEAEQVSAHPGATTESIRLCRLRVYAAVSAV